MQRRSTTCVVERRQLDCPPLVLGVLPHRLFPLVPFRDAPEQTKTGPQRDRLGLSGEEVRAITTRPSKEPQGPSKLREKQSCPKFSPGLCVSVVRNSPIRIVNPRTPLGQTAASHPAFRRRRRIAPAAPTLERSQQQRRLWQYRQVW